jgi:hypothetical protein
LELKRELDEAQTLIAEMQTPLWRRRAWAARLLQAKLGNAK